MRYILFFSVVFVFSSFSFAQKGKSSPQLKNAVVIGQLDNSSDRYSLEINMTELLTDRGVKTMPSLNVIKMGADSKLLASDSIQAVLKEKGFDTYVIIAVRGYDRKFKVAEKQPDFEEALTVGGLFELYRQDIVSISFEFKFYRNSEFVYGEIVKCGNISDRETVLKKFRTKVGKRISKRWL